MFVLFNIQNLYYIYSEAGEKLATNANGSLTYYRSVMVYGNDNKLLYIHHYFPCFFCYSSNCSGVTAGYPCASSGTWCIAGIGTSGPKNRVSRIKI